MKKIVSIIAIAVIGFGLVSCKKEENKTITDTTSPELIEADTTSLHRNVENTTVAGDSTAVVAQASAAPVSAGPSTTVALSENNHDFGKIKKGAKVEHIYEITNTGKTPLVISEVKPGCGCTAPQFTKEPILPGKKGQITLSFDSAAFEGAVQKYADVFANVEKSPIRLTFSATVNP
ncbi:MAG: DUF1573 domain-containing protein [Chryseobacterium sp.]|nr:DUF1573 domain-containing protein [Candidatus Chryseobacterium enterohippi]